MYIRRIFCVDYSSYSPQVTRVFAALRAVNEGANLRKAGLLLFFSIGYDGIAPAASGAIFGKLLSLVLSS
jgi:hypothetical protein